MSRSESDRLADIGKAIDRCLSYQEHLGMPEVEAMAYDAILRNLAVIGEAVKSLPTEYRAARPQVEWAAIAGLRNVVVHEYFRVDADIVRDILDNHLTTLRDAIN